MFPRTDAVLKRATISYNLTTLHYYLTLTSYCPPQLLQVVPLSTLALAFFYPSTMDLVQYARGHLLLLRKAKENSP